jgi:hypothetical protein
MASKKLAQAVAARQVIVKNMTSGEISLNVEGKRHIVASRKVLNLSEFITDYSKVTKIGGLQEMLQKGMLTLI